jgi:hypothetical protein
MKMKLRWRSVLLWEHREWGQREREKQWLRSEVCDNHTRNPKEEWDKLENGWEKKDKNQKKEELKCRKEEKERMLPYVTVNDLRCSLKVLRNNY